MNIDTTFEMKTNQIVPEIEDDVSLVDSLENKTMNELINICKEQGLKGFSKFRTKKNLLSFIEDSKSIQLKDRSAINFKNKVSKESLEKLTVKQLKDFCRIKKYSGFIKKNKLDLIDLILNPTTKKSFIDYNDSDPRDKFTLDVLKQMRQVDLKKIAIRFSVKGYYNCTSKSEFIDLIDTRFNRSSSSPQLSDNEEVSD